MKQLIILITFVLSNTIFAQSFEEKIKEASSAYADSNYRISADLYAAAFKIHEGDAGQYYNAACSWALTGDTLVAIRYLGLAAKHGWNNVKHLKRDTDLSNLHQLTEWQTVIDMVQKNVDEFEKDFDKPLKEQLEKIYVKDQMLRQLYEQAQDKFGRESDEMNYFWELMSQQDSLNELEVVAIIEKHGWVGISKVGGQANMVLWLVIQHAPIETQEKYLPLLRESVLAGESGGNHLAMLEDRILMRNDLPQTYGSQIVTDEDGNQKVYEIRDPEYVNQRREEVGLGPIENYVSRWGIVWTIEQKKQ